MITNQDQFHVLLVHPPVVSPVAPPWASARIAAHLKPLCLDQYDANLDFFLNHFLAPEYLTGLVDVIEDRERQGNFKDIDTDAITLLADFSANRGHWDRKIAQIDRSLKLLRTDDFYVPEHCLYALKEIRELLSLGSLAFYPSCIRWDGYSNSAVRDRTQVEAFCEDPVTNPFLSFCQQRLNLRITQPNLDLLIITVHGPDQLLAALTMARFCKRQRQDVHVAFLGHDAVLPFARDFSDSQLPDTDLNPLIELITRLAGINVRRQPTGPDFTGLPLMDYVVPTLTLPVGKISGPGPDGSPPSSLLTVLKKQVTELGAECFFVNNDRLTPAYMSEIAADMAGERPPFGLGLTCSLDGSTTPEAIAAARRAGVKLIWWRDPAGQLETLIKTLWDASKTNVWNHVFIPAEPENRLVKDLIHFMTTNPNIVHSWCRHRSANAPFGGSVDLPEEALGGYNKVAPLPGRSFWRCLNDPVYLLLYVNRHDVEKVMRFRVQDDAPFVRGLGVDMVFHFVKPQELQPEYLDEICRMVDAGGSVGSTWVRYNLERAFLIGYAIENGVIVGNSSLKHPRPQYVKAVNKQSGLDLSKYLERGYTSVRPEYRGMGIGTKLLAGLTARAGKRKIFSIISEDNTATQKIALRNNTKRVATFYSERLGKDVGVWIPETMLED